MVKRSHGKLSNLFVDAHHAGSDRHIHKLGLSVHLKTPLDCSIHLILNSESFTSVLRVSLKSRKHLRLLVIVQWLSRNDSDFLLLVKLLVEFLVFNSDVFQRVKTLILRQHSQEVDSALVERSNRQKSLIHFSDFAQANTTILCEETERLAVSVELGQVHQVFVDVEESAFLGSGCK